MIKAKNEAGAAEIVSIFNQGNPRPVFTAGADQHQLWARPQQSKVQKKRRADMWRLCTMVGDLLGQGIEVKRCGGSGRLLNGRRTLVQLPKDPALDPVWNLTVLNEVQANAGHPLSTEAALNQAWQEAQAI